MSAQYVSTYFYQAALYCVLVLNEIVTPVSVENVCLGLHSDFSVALCEGQNACVQNEVCVYPGVCRCKPGFYGFQCKTREC